MKQRGHTSISGWLVIDKPKGLSSAAVVNRVLNIVQAKKAGHAGTLDPMATGILPIAIGEATKVVQYAMGGIKKYAFTVKFGSSTDTCDAEGVLTQSGGRIPTEEELQVAVLNFVGTIDQIPPAYSAIKINGKRAYDLARKGETVVMLPRKTKIYSFNLLSRVSDTEFSFEAVCGKGTYVRSLARDLAEKLGTYGHLTALRRLRVGKFEEKNAISLEKLEELVHNGALFDELLPVDTALDDILVFDVSRASSDKLKNGQSILIDGDSDFQKACVKYNNKVIALGTIKDKFFKPERVFNY